MAPGRGPAQVVDGMNRHSPELAAPVVIAGQGQGRGERIAGQQPQAALAAAEAPQDEAAVMDGHHHQADPGLKTAIDHQQIAVDDAIAAHRITFNPHEEGGQGRRDQLKIEIDACFDIVIGRAGEAGGDGLPQQSAAPGRTLDT